MTTTTRPTGPAGGNPASVLVAALERAWAAIRRRHPQVPEVVMAVASGSVGRRGELKLGHFADRRWTVASAERPELFVGGEGLAAGPVEVLGTLLHEAAHGLAATRGVQDTSRQGRYHNRRYATLARELGLTVQRAGSRGWTATTIPAETQAVYAAVIDDLGRALVLWRRAEHASPGKPTSNLLAAVCSCGRRIRAARSTLAQAPVLCGRCGQAFQPPEPPDHQRTGFDT
jgi:hypothetical protein